MSGLPYMELEEIGTLLGYRNVRCMKDAIRRGTFEIPTYSLAGRRVANVSVIRNFFAEKDYPITAEEFLND